MVSALATRLAGSADLYEHGGRAPYHSINFITSHDGFTLAGLVSYNVKHNESNGEDNRDGSNDEHSWNCGEEGPAALDEVRQLRTRQVKNMAALLLLAQGAPMILGGDEMGRTQGGNNNAYCHDNETSWFNWKLLEANNELFRFFKLMIEFRKAHPLLRQRSFEGGAISWHGTTPFAPDWSWESRSLGLLLRGTSGSRDIFVIANAHWESRRFALPDSSRDHAWHRFADTSLPAPEDVVSIGTDSSLIDPHSYIAAPRSVVVLVGK